jgi:hypothetical protein
MVDNKGLSVDPPESSTNRTTNSDPFGYDRQEKTRPKEDHG